jgi:outer membrane protein OmpA-like peptidoglycan-associated protein
LAARAQSVPGLYVGAEGGLNWMFNKTFYSDLSIPDDIVPFTVPTIPSFSTGWALGGMAGYDFVGPRVELEGLFRQNGGTVSSNVLGATITRNGITVSQTTVMANVYYDFMADRAFTPYIGAGAGVAFVNTSFGQQLGDLPFDINSASTQFAYQYMMGVGYKIASNLRVNLEGRYYATTAPTFQRSGLAPNPGGDVPIALSGSYSNNDITVLASLQYKFGMPTEGTPPPVAQALSSHAQNVVPGFYVGIEGGLNWMFNNFFDTNLSFSFYPVPLGVPTNASFNTGSALGGMVGYDFVGPRVELEGLFRQNNGTISSNVPPRTILSGDIASGGINVNQTSVMANVYYDFMADQAFTPYIGAGAGVAFVNTNIGQQFLVTPLNFNISNTSTQFAYQYMMGVGYKITPNLRLNLEGRYYGTTAPSFQGNASLPGFPPVPVSGSYPNNSITVLASLQYKLGAPAGAALPPPAPPAQAPSFMVFFDWDRSNLSQQALSTIQQAADAFKATGKARITATGHTDRSGPETYNMALSLRRANAVKDALVRDGVPATVITVIGKGETQPLVQTADGVREPQNRRVEIILD